MQRQQVIAEQAANEKKDSNELKMQENFLAQKFWSAFLKSKMAFVRVVLVDCMDAWMTNGLAIVQSFGNPSGRCLGWLLHCRDERHVHVLTGIARPRGAQLANVIAVPGVAFASTVGGRPDKRERGDVQKFQEGRAE